MSFAAGLSSYKKTRALDAEGRLAKPRRCVCLVYAYTVYADQHTAVLTLCQTRNRDIHVAVVPRWLKPIT